MTREWRDFIIDIEHAMANAVDFLDGMSYDTFEKDEKTSSAVIRQVEIIGEAVKHIPDDVTSRYPDIPWKMMAGMRDRLIHAYFGVDLNTVFATCTDEIPRIRPLIKRCIAAEVSDN